MMGSTDVGRTISGSGSSLEIASGSGTGEVTIKATGSVMVSILGFWCATGGGAEWNFTGGGAVSFMGWAKGGVEAGIGSWAGRVEKGGVMGDSGGAEMCSAEGAAGTGATGSGSACEGAWGLLSDG